MDRGRRIGPFWIGYLIGTWIGMPYAMTSEVNPEGSAGVLEEESEAATLSDASASGEAPWAGMTPLSGGDLGGSVLVHGFGSWGYGRTSNRNLYLYGSKKGDYRNADFSLNLTFLPYEHLSFTAQVTHVVTGTDATSFLGIAFGQWAFSNGIEVRIGKIKQPFGIFTELYHVGTTRLFLNLPYAVYGPAGMMAEAYYGVGASGQIYLGDLTLAYDLYGGELDLDLRCPRSIYVSGTVAKRQDHLRNTVGGRLVLSNAFGTMRGGLSGYTGEEIQAVPARRGRRTTVGAFVEYAGDPVELRGEYAYNQKAELVRIAAFYVEGGLRFFDHYQLVGRYEHATTEVPGIAEERIEAMPSFLDHDEWAAGVNYDFRGTVVLRASYHHIEGNRYAAPRDDVLSDVLEAGTLDRKTDLFMAGAQFSF